MGEESKRRLGATRRANTAKRKAIATAEREVIEAAKAHVAAEYAELDLYGRGSGDIDDFTRAMDAIFHCRRDLRAAVDKLTALSAAPTAQGKG